MKTPSLYQDYMCLAQGAGGLFYIMGTARVPNVPENCFFGHVALWDGEKFRDAAHFDHPDGMRSYAIKDTPAHRAMLARCAVGEGYRISIA